MSRKRKLADVGKSLVSTEATEKVMHSRVPSYYLMKSEPYEFSIDALSEMPNCTSGWEGVRNYQARNNLSAMKIGDRAFFYHSNAKSETGIVGIVEIVRESYPDATATIPAHKYYDERSKKENKWVSVDVKLVEKWKQPVLLPELKSEFSKPGSLLANMQLLKNTRLSVQTVTSEEWSQVLDMRVK